MGVGEGEICKNIRTGQQERQKEQRNRTLNSIASSCDWSIGRAAVLACCCANAKRVMGLYSKYAEQSLSCLSHQMGIAASKHVEMKSHLTAVQ